MSESYVRPPLVAREPAPRWFAILRFRVVALVVLVAAAYVLFLVFQQVVTGVSGQDPGVNALTRLLGP